MRYLEQLQFKLVKESVQERSLLLKNASNLVKPLPFLYPLYKDTKYPKWLINLGLNVYDRLFFDPYVHPHTYLKKEEVLKIVPGLKEEGLKGAFLFYDAQLEDARLVIENLKAAEKLGAKIHNYTEITQLDLPAKVVVNTTGAWAGRFLPKNLSFNLTPSKGSHIVLPSFHPTHALFLKAPRDGRVFFILPWKEESLVGTTDTPFSGNLDELTVTEEEKNYLLEGCRHYFPHQSLGPIISSFAGIRPLATFSSKSTYATSREHVIHTHENTLTLLGGKFTTHRLMAEQTVDKVFDLLKIPKRPCQTRATPLEISSCNIQQAIQHEHAKHLEDWFFRRTTLAYQRGNGLNELEAAAKEFQTHLGWSETTLQEEIRSCRQKLQSS